MTVVYLAGPIDFAGSDANVGLWRHLATEALKELEIVVKDPSSIMWGPYGGTPPPPDVIWYHNQQWVIQSDGVLAFCPPNVMTVGTWMEVEFARGNETPVVVVSEKGSWQLEGAGIRVYPIRHVVYAVEELARQIELRRREIEDTQTQSVRK